jgi:t-SNARE complex subunit (syntaxin)
VSNPDYPDNIESNIDRVADDTQGAATELATASEYQRKAGRRAACLGLILIIVVAVVLLAVSGLVYSLAWNTNTHGRDLNRY